MEWSLVHQAQRHFTNKQYGTRVCENKVELVLRTNETYFHKQLAQTLRVIRNPVILRLISLKGGRRRLRRCLCAKNRTSLQTG